MTVKHAQFEVFRGRLLQATLLTAIEPHLRT